MHCQQPPPLTENPTTAPTGSVSKPELYELGLTNTNECPATSKAADKAACKAFANSETIWTISGSGMKYKDVTERFFEQDDSPKGCILYKKQVMFNTHAKGGPNKGGVLPVCVLDPGA